MLTATLSDLANRLDPSLLMEELGFEPDPHQRAVMRSLASRLLILAHRQSGKSTSVAALALHTALYDPGLVLLISRSQRQADELYRKVAWGYRQLGEPVPSVTDRSDTLALINGSRIVSLPNSPDTIVGFSGPKLIVVDEAARVPDEVFMVINPMLLVSRGRLVELSTPRGKRGHFFHEWRGGGDGYERVEFRASRNPRVAPEWLAEQRRILGERWYRQEFECSFEEIEGAAFDSDAVEAAFVPATRPPIDAGGTL